ncbi:acyltransferase [Pseudomonas sp. CAU 1711]|uniref:acyltransferase family protein n=1 Tax=Pseudomonas sp. CAU 1711 TaxID=3140356 RepID=UPI003260DBA5
MAIQDKTYFKAFDGLRGLAAIAVALLHWLLSFVGYLAVDFFLVLSGFILAHRYLYAASPVSSGKFVLSRFARLYPMHLFGLLSYTLAHRLLVKDIPRYPDGTLFTLLQQLTLTHNIGLNSHGQTWNVPSWSISMEFWLNVLFFCCIHRNTSSLPLLLISVIGLTVIYNLTGHIDTTYQNYFQIANSGLLRGWSSFVLGIIAYRGWRLARTIEWPPLILLLAKCVICISALALLFARSGNLSLLDIFAPIAFTALVVELALEQGILAWLVAKLQWLGTISYSIYLNHLIILMVIDCGLVHLSLSHVQLTPLYLGGLLAYFAITYRRVETAGKRLITKLSITC